MMGQNSDSATKLWLDDEYRTKVVSATRQGKNNPKSRAKRSNATKLLWTDPEYLEKMSKRDPPPNKLRDDQKIEKLCGGCKLPFLVLPSRRGKKFCSKSCQKLVKPLRGKLADKICDACSSTYTPISGSQRCCKDCVPTHIAGGRWTKFKLTQPMYDEIKRLQDYKCFICLRLLDELPTHMVHLDHCHVSNRVRGILCQRCNLLIGMLESSVGTLERVTAYLHVPI